MNIFVSIFSVSISLFFFSCLSIAAYSWIFYLSATIHKDYMFLFCNTLLVFISLNSRSSISLAGKRQAAAFRESISLDTRRTVGETLSTVVEETYGVHYGRLVAGDDKTLLFNIGVTRADELDAVEDDRTLSVIEETKRDELETVEDDKTLSVVEKTQDDDFKVEGPKTLRVVEELQGHGFEAVENAKILRVVEEVQDDDFEVVEDDKTISVIEEAQDDELEAVEGYKTLSVDKETLNDDEPEQGGSVDNISLEELNRKCEEFIRRMKKDIMPNNMMPLAPTKCSSCNYNSI